MDAYGNAVIDERIRYEVDEQTRGLLHHSKATHATIRKCVSRTIGKKLQQEASEVSNHSSLQPRRSVNSNMGKNNNNDNEENFTNSNNDLDTIGLVFNFVNWPFFPLLSNLFFLTIWSCLVLELFCIIDDDDVELEFVLVVVVVVLVVVVVILESIIFNMYIQSIYYIYA